MKKSKVLLLLGHPNNDSLCAALLASYAEGARASGSEVRIQRLADLAFDPNLHQGYHAIQDLEPDLLKFQDDLHWADHFVMVFPLWWGGMPAGLQGLIDRTFLPGFAFKYNAGSPFPQKLLQGRSAEVLLTMDSPAFWYKWVLGSPLSKRLRGQILGFSGFKPLKIHLFGNVRGSDAKKRQEWLDRSKALGARR